MSVYSEFIGDTCPCCHDIMTEHSNYRPVWSDDFDTIVCQTCYDDTRCRFCQVSGGGVEGGVCEECFADMPMGEWVS